MVCFTAKHGYRSCHCRGPTKGGHVDRKPKPVPTSAPQFDLMPLRNWSIGTEPSTPHGPVHSREGLGDGTGAGDALKPQVNTANPWLCSPPTSNNRENALLPTPPARIQQPLAPGGFLAHRSTVTAGRAPASRSAATVTRGPCRAEGSAGAAPVTAARIHFQAVRPRLDTGITAADGGEMRNINNSRARYSRGIASRTVRSRPVDGCHLIVEDNIG